MLTPGNRPPASRGVWAPRTLSQGRGSFLGSPPGSGRRSEPAPPSPPPAGRPCSGWAPRRSSSWRPAGRRRASWTGRPACTAAWPPTAGATWTPCWAASASPSRTSRRRSCGQSRARPEARPSWVCGDLLTLSWGSGARGLAGRASGTHRARPSAPSLGSHHEPAGHRRRPDHPPASPWAHHPGLAGSGPATRERPYAWPEAGLCPDNCPLPTTVLPSRT